MSSACWFLDLSFELGEVEMSALLQLEETLICEWGVFCTFWFVLGREWDMDEYKYYKGFQLFLRRVFLN